MRPERERERERKRERERDFLQSIYVLYNFTDILKCDMGTNTILKKSHSSSLSSSLQCNSLILVLYAIRNVILPLHYAQRSQSSETARL